MNISDNLMEAEPDLISRLAEQRWVLVKKLRAIDEQLQRSSRFWNLDDDGLVELV